MAAIRPRDLLSDGLLERLGGTSLAAKAPVGGDIAAFAAGRPIRVLDPR